MAVANSSQRLYHWALSAENKVNPMLKVSRQPVVSIAVIAFTSDVALDGLTAAWLHEKSNRSDSASTHRTYRTFLADFRAALAQHALDLDSDPRLVASLAQVWAAREVIDKSGILKPPSAAYHNQRLAALASFYEYAIRRGVLERDPIAAVSRRPIQDNLAAQPPDFEALRKKLAAIDRADLAGRRDHALLSLALTTGRRLAELTGLRSSDLLITEADSPSGVRLLVIWRRIKGGKTAADKLPASLSRDLLAYLHAFYGPAFTTLPVNSPVWVSLSHNAHGYALNHTSVAALCRRRLGINFHALRAACAVAMERSGARVTEIQAQLGHTDLSTTSRYLSTLKQAENPYAETILTLLGIA